MTGQAAISRPGSVRGRLIAWSFAGLIVPQCALAMSEEDRAFANYLIRELGYFDTAERWIAEHLARRDLDPTALGDYEALRIDILKVQGREEEALKALEDFQRKYSTHARAGVGSIEAVGIRLKRIILELLDVAAASPPEKAGPLYERARQEFDEQVSKPTYELIARLEERHRRTHATLESDSPEAEDELRGLILAELSRLDAHLEFARRLPQGSPERQRLLDKAAALAATFVGSRHQFPLMQYQGQLQRGMIDFYREDHERAEENLSVLYDIEPPQSPPYAKPQVRAYRNLRLQAILFGARANNAAANYQRARDVIEAHVIAPTGDEFDLSQAVEEPDLHLMANLVQLELGVALAGSGETTRGLEAIQRVIESHEKDDPLVVDARRALGRIATRIGVRLRARDLYQAGHGLKSDLRWEEALRTFQLALGAVLPENAAEMAGLAPLCLDQIGEIHYLLGRYEEAAIAFGEACEHFDDPAVENYSTVATRFLGAVTKAITRRPDGTAHAPLNRLKESATRYSGERGRGLEKEDTLRFDAAVAEAEGKFEVARRKYLEIPPEARGLAVPYYWFAQASAWTCWVRQWEQWDDAERQARAGELEQAKGELARIAARAREGSDLPGAAKAALTLGQVHTRLEEWAAAAAALHLYATELARVEPYGCPGLGTLIVAQARTGDLAAASDNFATLEAACPEEPAVGIAARELSDGFRDAREPEKSAEYMLRYARHPSSRADSEDPEELARIAERLVEGRRSAEAREFIGRIREMASAGRVEKSRLPELDRQVIFLEAKVLIDEGEWDEAISVLEGYIDRFPPRNSYYFDPYVVHELAGAYRHRSDPAPAPVEALRKADRHQNSACALMRERAKLDPALEPVFYAWLLEFVEVKVRIGDSGDSGAYRSVLSIIGDHRHTEMGGLKSRFLELEQLAEEKLRKSSGGR